MSMDSLKCEFCGKEYLGQDAAERLMNHEKNCSKRFKTKTQATLPDSISIPRDWLTKRSERI